MHYLFFDVEMQGAHNASVDVDYTRRCFFELVKMKVIRVKEYLCSPENSKIWAKERRINKQLKYYSVKKTPKWNEIIKKYTFSASDENLSYREASELSSKMDLKLKGNGFKRINELFLQKLTIQQERNDAGIEASFERMNAEIGKLVRSLKMEYSKNDTNTIVDYNYMVLSLINCDWIDIDSIYISYYEWKQQLYVSLPLPYKSYVNHIKEVRYSYKKDELYNIYYTTEEFNEMYQSVVSNYLTLIISRFFYANSSEAVQSVCVKVRSKQSPFKIYLTRKQFEQVDLK